MKYVKYHFPASLRTIYNSSFLGTQRALLVAEGALLVTKDKGAFFETEGALYVSDRKYG